MEKLISRVKAMLNVMDDSFDKREGSIFYDAVAPVALELELQQQKILDATALLLLNTTQGEFLDNITQSFGVFRNYGEEDKELRERFVKAIKTPDFRGSVADYEQYTKELLEEGYAKVFLGELIGEIKIVVANQGMCECKADEVAMVESFFNGSDADGAAPVGHIVFAKSCVELPIYIEIKLLLDGQANLSILKEDVEKAIYGYVNSLGFEENTVFVARIISEILNCNSKIKDVALLTLNGAEKNILLEKSFERFEIAKVKSINMAVIYED